VFYRFSPLEPGAYVVEVNSKGFQNLSKEGPRFGGVRPANSDFALTMAGVAQNVTVSAAPVENAYRVDTVNPVSPLGTTPILDLPYSVKRDFAPVD